MKTVQLFLVLMIAQFYTLAQNAQAELKSGLKNNFSLEISTFNHAERSFKGTMHYTIFKNRLKVVNQELFDSTKHLLYSEQLSKSAESNIKASIKRLDTLKDLYFNYCVMITSGEELYIGYELNGFSRGVSLHHYYLETIEELVKSLNAILPPKYRIIYLSKETKQDCVL